MRDRKGCKAKIKNGATDEPIFEALYFMFDEAEFAYMKFDLFLLAVAYALQGKMVLLEYHSDHWGGEQQNSEIIHAERQTNQKSDA